MASNLDKIILGDCFEELKKIKKESIDLVVADPPYGIDQIRARD